MIPYGRQDITEDDIQAVVDVLKSDFLTQGPAVPAFEQALAATCGTQEGVAVSSATAALHIACLALGLGEGDWLWTTPITFVASANCGLYCGAQVDFVDIDPLTFNLCPKQLELKLLKAEAEGCLPKVVIPVHLTGRSCDMAAIHALSQRFGFRIIEDASHAIGASHAGSRVGCGQYSDITVFSFHPVKIITTAEGGMAVTRNKDLAQHMRRLRSHGVTRDESEMTRAPDGGWYYQQVELGFNYRMTELQAALGLSQLQRLDDFVQRRRELAAQYQSLLSGLPLTLPNVESDADSAWHLYVIQLQDTSRRAEVFESLRQAGIGVNVHYIPVHTQPHYEAMGFRQDAFPKAQAYYAGAISLPLFATMTDQQQGEVVAALKTALAS